jgi:AcrR family transcriptional regulator
VGRSSCRSIELNSNDLVLYSIEMRAVKSPAGSLRAEQAAVTERRVLAAARTLFSDRGYGATTLREIAAEARVAVQTVYAVFGSKANILRVLQDSVVHDAAASAAFSAALQAPDADAALHLFARSIRLRWEHGHDVVRASTQAAATDPEVREETEAALRIRRGGIAHLAAKLDRTGEAARIAATLDALSLPELFADLVTEHGWSADDYEAWLVSVLRSVVTSARD